jgi:PHP family Zn ribbon phosphoesterase
MAIERLKKDARCSECGALLKKGTRAKVYRRSDGTVLVYGFDCHKRQSTDNSDALSDALSDIRRALWTIVELLKKGAPKEIATEQVLDEIAEEAQKPQLTQKDWARFWGTVKRMGLDRETVHEYLGVESVKEVAKTPEDLEEILERLKQDLAF